METRGRKEPRKARRSRDTRDTKSEGQFGISRVSDPVVQQGVTRLRTRDVPWLLPTRPRMPESTPEQEEDEPSQLRNEGKDLLTRRGDPSDVLGYVAGGEESPVIGTTEEEQVDKAIIKGMMDKEKENAQQKSESLYDNPAGTLPLPLITWDSDEKPLINIPGITKTADPVSELKSLTGGTETLYLNLTPSETGEELAGAGATRTPPDHSQAAAALVELERLQLETSAEKNTGVTQPRLDLTTELKERGGPQDGLNESHQQKNPHGEVLPINLQSEIGDSVTRVEGQKGAPAETSTGLSATNLQTDGGARPKNLGNSFTPVRVQLQFDFYLPGGKKVSESPTYQINNLTPEGNQALMVKIPKLQGKYHQNMYMLDLQTGRLYQIHGSSGKFQLVEERGYLHPTESIWADMSEALQEEYLRVNNLNRELQLNIKADQSKVTSTPFSQSEAPVKPQGKARVDDIDEVKGISPIKGGPDPPKKPPRREETPRNEPTPIPQPRNSKIENGRQNEGGKDKAQWGPIIDGDKEKLSSASTIPKVPKTPMPTTPLNIDPAVLNRRRSEMIARLPKEVSIPATIGTSPLQLIKNEEYYLEKLQEVQEARIKVVSLRRQNNLMGYGPEITDYIGPIYEERQQKFEEQEMVVKKIIDKINQLKDKWCYPIIFPLMTIQPGTTDEEQRAYYENERVLCETLRQATSEIYQRRIKTCQDPQAQNEEVNKWKQWIKKITLKERELGYKIESLRRNRVEQTREKTILESKDMTVDTTLPLTPAQQVLQENVHREHLVPGIVYSREVSRSSSTSRPTDDEARQSQEEAIELCRKIFSVTEDEEPYANVRIREEKNKKKFG